MKQFIKYRLSRLGILPTLDLGRRLPEIANWIKRGCIGPAPAPIKRKVLSAYLRRFELGKFIETGTHFGDTLAFMAQNKNTTCTSIEFADSYYERAVKRFESYPNVEVLHGDSGVLLPSLVEKLEVPALFWLDGHWSGGDTGRAELDSPVSAELDSILRSSTKNHVILIDDARCFDGSGGYPQLDNLLRTVREQSKYVCEVSTDIIRLTPPGSEHL